MKAKKIVALFLAIAMTFSLVACGTNNSDPSADPGKDVEETVFPEGPVKIIVQYAPGGGADVVARLLAKYAEEYLGVSVVVENVTGGSGVVGLTTVANSKADGYTMGIILANTAIEGMITEGVTYDLDSFDPIVQINFDPVFMVARAGSEWDTDLSTIIDRSKNEEVMMGIGALWQAFDFVKMSLTSNYNANFTRVAYDGGAGACTAVVSGDVDVAMVFPSEWVSYYNSGDLVGIAVSSAERLEAFPNVPTFSELGYDTVENIGVRRVLAVPAGTDPKVIAVLERAFMQALNDPELIAEFAALGMSVVPASASEAVANLNTDSEVLGGLIKEFGVKPGDAPK